MITKKLVFLVKPGNWQFRLRKPKKPGTWVMKITSFSRKLWSLGTKSTKKTKIKIRVLEK